MNPTNKLAHFKNGSNSVLGLPIFTDANGDEFVRHENRWAHVSEVPLEQAKNEVGQHHVVEMSEAKPKRVPQHRLIPIPPKQVEAFLPTPVPVPPAKPLFRLDEAGKLIPNN